MAHTTLTAQALQPVSVEERIDLIDVVRGFALYGVLLANLVWITTDVVLTDARQAQLPTAALDRLVKPLIVFFVDHKFYTLFSFLFGLGFAIQLTRAEQRGRDVVSTYARRILILGVIGVLHIALLWYGDILFLYAIGGFGLLVVRRWNLPLLLALALTLALFARPVVGLYPLLTGQAPATRVDSARQDDVEKERLLAVFDAASYGALIAENRSHYYGDIVARGIGLFLFPQIFARFLLGLYVGRKRWVYRTADLVPLLRRLLPWAILLGVVGNGVMVVIDLGLDSYWAHAIAVVEEAGILALAFSYLAGLVLLFHHSPRWRERLGYLAPVGQMALTNYLTHSVLYLLLLSGVGLGLYGEVGPALCVVLSAVIFAAQMAFSRWWLARYRFGPAEWLWRTLTYGERQPIRATVTARAT
jgi:uncharacterized protein